MDSSMENEIKVLELFSGIGGMHFALKESGINAQVIAAADINTIANAVYHYNFPKTSLIKKNIQSFTKEFLNNLNADMILMSPPCQPFTRGGNKKDISDNRCVPSLHIANILPFICGTYILLENVKGFETSKLREKLIESLQNSNYSFLEFMISPLQFGIPNSRERYYLLAKRSPLKFSYHQNELITVPSMLVVESETYSIENILDIEDSSPAYDAYLVPKHILKKKIWIMDVVTKNSNRSGCFTKSYSRYVLGTGSFYSPFDELYLRSTLEKIKNLGQDKSDLWLNDLLSLKIRFFTPREVARLMGFPETFTFPINVTDKQKYKLLGNSLNIIVVSKLIQFLTKEKEND